MPFKFPDVSNATEEGLIAIGAELDKEILESAYRQGIFPWPVNESYPMTWFSPDPRGIIRPERLHISKSLKKFIAKSAYEIKINDDFESIIKHCATIKRTHEQGSWIFSSIISAYTQLYKNSKAYCIGAYLKNELVGGLYGVSFGEIISGESMFSYKDNASKLCLIKLLEIVANSNIPFVDTQMTTPVIESMGGEKVPREQFIKELQKLNSTKGREEIFGS